MPVTLRPASERYVRRQPQRLTTAPEILTAPRFLLAYWIHSRGAKGASIPFLVRSGLMTNGAARKVIEALYDFGLVQSRVQKRPRKGIAAERVWRLTKAGEEAIELTQAYYQGGCIGATMGPGDTPDRNGEST